MDLLTSMKIYDVFYPSLLQKASHDPLPGQHNDLVPPVIINDKEEWEVDNILDARRIDGRKIRGKSGRKVGGKVQYRVKWKRYDENKEWYDAAGFEHSKELVEDFYKRNPTKPRQE